MNTGTTISIILAIFAFIFIIGLCIGSFLNVVILRALSNESIVFPASKCPKCNHTLKWWHNIPVISYILLRGKCGFCKDKISIQYPIVELLTGVLFVGTFIKFFIAPLEYGNLTLGNFMNTIYAWIVVSLFVVLAGTDIKEKVVFDKHTYSLVGIGLLYSIIITVIAIVYSYQTTGQFPLNTSFLIHNRITYSILGIILGVVIMEVLARLGYLFAGTRAFGEGDTFIAAGIGAIFGYQRVIPALFLSLLIQFIITLPIFIKKLWTNKDYSTIGALTGFISYAIVFGILQNHGYLYNNLILIGTTIPFVAIGLYTCFRILRGIKENSENMMYLPFGPAMVMAALLMLIFLKYF